MAREMKDSGVSWIGKIPEIWGIIRFKYLHNGLNTGEAIDKIYWSSDENNRVFYTAGLVPIRTNYESFSEWKYTTENDLLLARNGTPYVYYPEADACYTDHIIRAIMKSGVNKRYVQYCLQQSISSVVVETVSLPTWSASLWNEQSIAWPSNDEQKAIVNFLDHTCAEIDAIVEKTKATIEECRKLKQAIITRAVTKGIRGDRPMKDSGIEWVRDLPLDWKTIPSKHVFSNSDERKRSDDVLLTASQKHGIISQQKYMEKEETRIVLANKGIEDWKHVEPNDFIISLRSFQGGLEISEVSGCITWHYIVLKAKIPLHSLYFKWLFKSELYIKALQRTCNFIRDGQDLRYSNFAQVPLFIPPIAEQVEIANYLNEKCAEINALIDRKSRFLSELEAYKKSLIYEYVTGKKEVSAE